MAVTDAVASKDSPLLKHVRLYGEDPDAGNLRALAVDGSGFLQTTATLTVAELKIGAVEIKDGVTDERTTVNSDGSLSTTGGAAGATLVHDQKTVTTAGAAEALVAVSTAVSSGKKVSLKALHTNTNAIFIGGSTVDSTNGYHLYPGEPLELSVTNLNIIYIDVTTNGEGVSYIIEGS